MAGPSNVNFAIFRRHNLRPLSALLKGENCSSGKTQEIMSENEGISWTYMEERDSDDFVVVDRQTSRTKKNRSLNKKKKHHKPTKARKQDTVKQSSGCPSNWSNVELVSLFKLADLTLRPESGALLLGKCHQSNSLKKIEPTHALQKSLLPGRPYNKVMKFLRSSNFEQKYLEYRQQKNGRNRPKTFVVSQKAKKSLLKAKGLTKRQPLVHGCVNPGSSIPVVRPYRILMPRSRQITEEERLQRCTTLDLSMAPGQHDINTSSDQHYINTPSDQHDINTPSDQHYINTPSDQHDINTPSDQHYINTPSDQHDINTPSDQHYINTPSDQHHMNTPSDQHHMNTPSDQHHMNTPSDQHHINTPSDQHHINTPSDQHHINTPSERHHMNTLSDQHHMNTPSDQHHINISPSSTSRVYNKRPQPLESLPVNIRQVKKSALDACLQQQTS
uniref:Uncharacterized protein LOC102801749 n=1 Tax=Saccoglossus kowalevskii TaxID=10224 RepID=A0ABM0M717_SACKO|nr:PREDICTED: uncharacterized protein LOC102801749 [Saccoglossus kowalevskii]